MPERRFNRHDLVWLDARQQAALVADPAQRDCLHTWIGRGLPLVVGRRNPDAKGLQLGFTLPGIRERLRVGVQAPLTAVQRHQAAPLLADLLAEAPKNWQGNLKALLAAFADTQLQVRVYGSLVNHIYSGQPCLRESSDLDLLIECRGQEDIHTVLPILRHYQLAPPRLDGELRLPDSSAVAWRELDQALEHSQPTLLVKSNTGVSLCELGAFLSYPTASKGEHAPD